MEPGIVTVFGGSGFAGRQIVQALARTGARIRVVCRRPEDAAPCKTMGDVGQIVPVAGNIRNRATIAAAVQGADTVVNVVGILFERGRQTFDAVHRTGAAAIAEEASRAGVGRFVHISAIGADEHARSSYARSKGQGEAAVREAFPGAVILRPSVIFGPEDPFFSLLAAMARLSPVLPLVGGGRTRFQPVYVCDVAAAVVRATQDPATAGRTFELGGPRIYSFRELLELLLRTTGRTRLLLPVPFWLARANAAMIEFALALPASIAPSLTPPPPITRDQVLLLRRDNVVSENAEGLAALGISPEGLEAKLPAYLARYRRDGGNFSRASGKTA